MSDATILSVRDMRVHFQVKAKSRLPWAPSRTLKAVDGVSFDLRAGETLGVVGESGCGKSTLSRAILNLIPATHGDIVWMGAKLTRASAREWHAVRADVQMIFQDPLASLDPRMTIGQIIAEPLTEHRPGMSRQEIDTRVRAMMTRVGLREQMINRYPHEFSGGQCQRVGIARALIVEPKLVICDEPVSALDVSIQAQIVNLLKTLQAEFKLSLIFIAHDLAVVRHISDRVMVMYLGRVMELADKEALYDTPRHPYTRALLSAVPVPDPAIERGKVVQILSGDIPSPIDPPAGCVFHTRCPMAQARCAQEVPALRALTPGASAACHFA
ncbi:MULTISPECIES: murein tripeptide/oligopeptide ABC transporter ATP binding protein OppF [unclassified Caballeronia]|uniref:murein tripeptide/oligopeptide ABC transporter ATP binding protein OppF n=1 Tax=unclassified Caballeronia TaxID=2646786 RepID=UPI0028568F42|nr:MULTISPECIES: murein tripeptide/oligopeptide ABC transporter ATP binding protein OppF [unclassified Caballeronia]MDR5739411.1 murein tripeptide/oligopeptide ABC transporter ATP binding protein OppF [Caballeronia sp. LZ016]MDR5807899.1 murein tripeptide/oligopeptide ABC transporter ATP binding protein OppF [Caballeronia sp. LZ019]